MNSICAKSTSFSFVVLSLFLLSIASCASVGSLNTPSTKPEVTIKNATKKEVIDALVAWSAMKGRQVEATTEYSVTTNGSISARTSNNVLWDETVMAQTRYTPVVKGTDVTLYAQRIISYVKESDVHDYTSKKNPVVGRTTQDITEEYNSQRAYEEMQLELEDFAKFIAQQK